MANLMPASVAAVILVKCPHCGTKQVRARGPGDQRLACKHCVAVFTIDDGRRRLLRAHTDPCR